MLTPPTLENLFDVVSLAHRHYQQYYRIPVNHCLNVSEKINLLSVKYTKLNRLFVNLDSSEFWSDKDGEDTS